MDIVQLLKLGIAILIKYSPLLVLVITIMCFFLAVSLVFIKNKKHEEFYLKAIKTLIKWLIIMLLMLSLVVYHNFMGR